MKTLNRFGINGALTMVMAACVVMPAAVQAQTNPAPTPTPTPTPAPAPMNTQPDNYDIRQDFERYQNTDRRTEEEKAYEQASDIADCVIRRSKDKADDYFGGPIADDPEYTRLSTVLRGKLRRCMDGARTPTPAYVINALLAEKLILLNAPVLDDRAASLNMDVAQPFYLESGKIASLGALTRCLAVFSPGLVHKVLQSNSASDKETQALSQLYASTPECGVQAVPDVTHFGQREALATSLFEWLNRNKGHVE